MRKCPVGRTKVSEGRKISNLRDVTINDLALLNPKMDDTIYRRLRHVVTENARVKDMVSAFTRMTKNLSASSSTLLTIVYGRL